MSGVLNAGLENLDSTIFDDYESRVMKLQGLIELTRVMASTLTEVKLYEIILHACQGQFLVNNAALVLLTNLENKMYENVMSTGLKDKYYNVRFTSQSPIYTLFTKEEDGVLTMKKKPHFNVEVNQLLHWDHKDNLFTDLQSEVIVPLWARTSFYGFLVIGSKLDGSNFNYDELDVIHQFSNIAAMSIENARLFDMAVLDKMTEVLNHHFFKSRLYEEMEKCNKLKQPLFLAMFDLDYFKSVNDTYGHQVGDFLLKTFSRTLKKYTPQSYLIGRYGGEEFAIAMPNVNQAEALNLLEKIRIGFSKLRFKTPDDEFQKTVSIGLAEYTPGSDISLTVLVEMADRALYHSKHHGKNQVTVYTKEQFGEI